MRKVRTRVADAEVIAWRLPRRSSNYGRPACELGPGATDPTISGRALALKAVLTRDGQRETRQVPDFHVTARRDRSSRAHRGRRLVRRPDPARAARGLGCWRPLFEHGISSIWIETHIPSNTGRRAALAPSVLRAASPCSRPFGPIYSSIWTPISTTRVGGMPKNAVAGCAFRARKAKRRSRQRAMPGRRVGRTVSLPRKKVT